MSVKSIKEISNTLKSSINKIIVGKSDTIDLILTAVIAGGHVLLEDTPGTGKTMLAKSLAKSIGGDFKRIQFTPDLLPSDVTGLNIFNQQSSSFEFAAGPVFTNILLADEINRATPRTQSSLLECMEEKQVTVDGNTRKLERPFLVIATQNPIETAGTFPLPEAQLDRFMMQLKMGFPDTEEELQIMDRFIISNPLDEVSPVCRKEDILEMSQLAASVFVHPSIRRYIVDIVSATRCNTSVSVGISPRGTLAILKASQVYAAIKDRNYVTPEDIKSLSVPVLAHRIVSYSGISNTQGKEAIIRDILDSVAVPTEDWSNK